MLDGMERAFRTLLALAVAFAIAAGAAAQTPEKPPAEAGGKLDVLFERLRTTPDPGEARRIEAAIWQIWLEPPDPASASLMQLALDAQNRGDLFGAFALFDAIVNLRPDYAEGWNRRATVLYQLGRYEDSRKDAEKTLALEPRHFGALSGLGLIAAAKNDEDAALDAMERALVINPHMAQVRANVEALRKKRRDGAI
ncbi:MAG: tetratricopeptide repeat protein [Proteobacteria bacterium]|nr:tetratricopeptide repeat protein [Pseudomonadota bacterium]